MRMWSAERSKCGMGNWHRIYDFGLMVYDSFSIVRHEEVSKAASVGAACPWRLGALNLSHE